MDSNTSNNHSGISILTIIIAIVNVIISLILFLIASNIEKNSGTNNKLIIYMIIMLNTTFFALNIRLINAVWIHNVDRIRHCLEIFIVLFVLNIIPIISKEERKFYHDDIIICSQIFFVIIVLEIYLVHLYYNYELKRSQQNVFPAHSLSTNPSAPIEQYHMASPHHTNQQSEGNTRIPLPFIFQPARQNAICQPYQNATQQSIQHAIEQPGQYVTQRPDTLAHCIVQTPLQPEKVMT